MTEISRRAFMGATAAAGAAVAVGLPGTANAADHRHGSIADVKHVVILMQENRSFDHYFGTLNGVRGFEDRQALVFPNGDSVFRQPDRGRTEGYLLPFRMDTTKYNAQNAGGLPHDWDTGHTAVNGGAMDKWVSAKGERTMGYFTRQDIPYQYALADAFTICDGYFCSMNGPTDPNRLYLWSGTAGPGRDGTTGPWTDNTPVTDNPVADWTTYAERLEKAGVSWRVYHNPDGSDDRDGDYDDNALSYFKQFHAFPKDDPRYVNAMTRFDLTAFDQHCKDGTLPTVSWLVAPYLFCEHPAASPDYGAHWVNTALQSLFSNPDVWEHTVFLLMYDENDGYFDHVIPPFPEPETPDEFAGDKPIGLGSRVPLWAISPWSRGGWVNSQVFDHTSVLRFLERVTGVREPNISDWRRAVCGDLTSCFDFTKPDYSIPRLPDTVALMAAADAGSSLPAVRPPAAGQQAEAVQEPGDRPHRPLPYRPWADVSVDRESGKVTCTLVNDGTAAFHFTVLSNLVQPFTGTPFTVAPRSSRTYVWDATATDGRYDFTVHGADGFVRRFAGTVVRAEQDDVAVPSVQAKPRNGGHRETASIELKLINDGGTEVAFTITPNDFGGKPQTVWVGPGDRAQPTWSGNGGRYDFTVTAGTGGRFAQRYAGTLHDM
ncbi:phosphocholine-specific phospholipase C [Streptosporangium sp. 'caverna']|uniref:phosphocholine-specific phospholipase C n=1 Tax=Streptosporangium sp. 'caverna' TaxID=2202249 RepID=UPI000D7D374B|nr:phospholipase C, phosphocholine-specific [Streptosporangium sp. 'caverna']AWS42808.1 phospholipase C, phosphocholine-specific [Streptosporangium sp. 'caverna']